MSTLRFAHITDLHISEAQEAWGTLGGAPWLVETAFTRFNADSSLDFVLITGDVLDRATPGELAQFRTLLNGLKKPWHFVPGNHDGFIDPAYPAALRPEQVVAGLDPRMLGETYLAGHAHWSRSVGDGFHLVGLDLRLAETWAGRIGHDQLNWLEDQLKHLRDQTVIIAVHHALYSLGPHNKQPWWSNFVAEDGPALEALLDRYPQVVMVLSGHHHAQHMRRRGPRLHIHTAALTGYPCAYRMIELKRYRGEVHARVQTHTVADAETLVLAEAQLAASDIAERYDPVDPSRWVAFCAGEPEDQSFSGILGQTDKSK